MSSVGQQMLLVSGSAPATIAFQGTYSPTVAGATATQAGVSFGPVANGRLVIIAVQWGSGFAGDTISSATIGALPASIAIAGTGLGVSAPFHDLAFITAYVPTGTSGTVAVTFANAGAGNVRFFVYQATNIKNQTPFGTGSTTSATSPTAVTCNLQGGGIVVATATTLAVSTPFTWSVVTKDYETSPAGTDGGGSALTPSSIIGAPVQFSDPGGPAGGPSRSLIVASFR